MMVALTEKYPHTGCSLRQADNLNLDQYPCLLLPLGERKTDFLAETLVDSMTLSRVRTQGSRAIADMRYDQQITFLWLIVIYSIDMCNTLAFIFSPSRVIAEINMYFFCGSVILYIPTVWHSFRILN